MPRTALKRRNNVEEPLPSGRPSKRVKAVKEVETSRARAKKTSKTPSIPTVNPLPTPPAHTRPCNSVFVWGTGEDGQFGMGVDHLGEFTKPQRNKWFESAVEKATLGGEGCGIESVAAGGFFSLFVDEEGKIWSCGNNDDASLGRATENIPDPVNPERVLDLDIAQSEPRVLQSLIDQKFRAVKIAAGGSIAGAIDEKGELRVWGTFRGSEGALGFSSGVKRQLTPTSIMDLKSKANEPERFAALASGNNHMLALTTQGNVLSWGAGEDGQLGRKIVERRKIHGVVPEKVILGSRSRKAVAIGTGSRHSFAVDQEGEVWGWGMDAMGQTGTDRATRADHPTVLLPTKIDALSSTHLGSKVVSCVGGDDHTLFLTADGRVFACGKSHGGRLGLPKDHPAMVENEDGSVPIPTHIPFPDSHTDDPVVQISVGTRASMAVTAAGALYSWGEANASELGIKDDETGQAATIQPTPKMVVKKEGGSWAAVSTACGGQHVCALFRKKT